LCLSSSLTVACLSDTAENLACNVGENLDCVGVKTTTCSFDISITTLDRLYFMLSCRPASPKALQASRACRVNSRVSIILVGSCPVNMCSPRHPGPGLLLSLEAYECLPHDDAELECLQGPDPRVGQERGGLWSLHLGVVCAEEELGEECWTEGTHVSWYR
jgi:hypothetical protein